MFDRMQDRLLLVIVTSRAIAFKCRTDLCSVHNVLSWEQSATGMRGAIHLLLLFFSSHSYSCYSNELPFNSSYAEIRLRVRDWSCVLPNTNDLTHATSKNIRWLMIGADEAVITGADYKTPGLVMTRYDSYTCLLICPTIRKQNPYMLSHLQVGELFGILASCLLVCSIHRKVCCRG